MANWWHRWLNPHCEHCKEEKLESQVCQSCEILKISLERLSDEKSRLLELVIQKNTPTVGPITNEQDLKPIRPSSRFTPWSVRQQILEAEDRKTAQLMKNKEVEGTGELEKELNIAAGTRENAEKERN